MARCPLLLLMLWVVCVHCSSQQHFVNIARNVGYTVTSSSLAHGSYDTEPINGDKDDCFSTDPRQGDQRDPYWQVDFRKWRIIHKITLHACQQNVSNMNDVKVSINNKYHGTVTANPPSLVTNFTQLWTKSVHIVKLYKSRGMGKFLNLAEVEVWECDPSYYGDNCDKPCGAGCKDGTCDSRTGRCTGGCNKGYKVNDGKCDQGCDPSYYGDNCDTPCGAGCKEGTCDSRTGRCTGGCSEGYKYNGGKCDQVCDKGLYGQSCRFRCNAECTEGCDHVTGACLDFTISTCPPGYHHPPGCSQDINECASSPCGNRRSCHNSVGSYSCQCQQGFTGNHCDEGCRGGSYGPNCIHHCSEGCQGHCNTETGQCSTCRSGWAGLKCEECDPSYYGDSCDTPCGAGCEDGTCDSQTGQCTGWSALRRCKDGYTSNDGKCDQECPDHYYGQDCKHRCGRCLNKEACDVISGHCPRGCDEGFYGPGCDKCAGKLWAQNCSLPCGHCADDGSCHIYTGHCSSSCQTGWTGAQCLTAGPESVHVGVVISATVAAAVVLASLTVVAVVLCRWIKANRDE